MSYYGIQQLFIDGAFINALGTDLLTKVSPIDGSLVAQIQCASRSDLKLAVRCAEKAGRYWQEVGVSERARVLHSAADLVGQNAAVLASLDSQDTGRDVVDILENDVVASVRELERHADRAVQISKSGTSGCSSPPRIAFCIGARKRPLKSAVTAVSRIIATGGAVILKPHETSCLSTLRLAGLFQDAGLPGGVLNVLTGPDELMAQWLAEYKTPIGVASEH